MSGTTQARATGCHSAATHGSTPLRDNLLKRFYAVCKRSGIEGAETGGNVDIHALPVSFIKLSIEHGGNRKAVQVIVGHSSLEMTMNVYARVTERGVEEAIAALPFAEISAPAHVISIQDAHVDGVSSGKSKHVVR